MYIRSIRIVVVSEEGFSEKELEKKVREEIGEFLLGKMNVTIGNKTTKDGADEYELLGLEKIDEDRYELEFVC